MRIRRIVPEHFAFSLSGIALALFFGGCMTSSSSSTAPSSADLSAIQDVLARSKVSLGESVTIAQQSLESGVGISAELIVNEAPAFSVGAVHGSRLHQVHVDIENGAVVSSKDVRDSNDPCPGAIPLAEAITIAESAVNGVGIEVQPDDDDACAREVQVLAGDKLWEVKIGGDGKVLEVEASDELGGDDDGEDDDSGEDD